MVAIVESARATRKGEEERSGIISDREGNDYYFVSLLAFITTSELTLLYCL